MMYPYDHNYSIYDQFASVRSTGVEGSFNYSSNMANDWIREQWIPQMRGKLNCTFSGQYIRPRWSANYPCLQSSSGFVDLQHILVSPFDDI